jgi:hypothetical protein
MRPRLRRRTTTRDLLYLSEPKMQALMHRLPDRTLRHLTVESGFDAGALAAVIDLIEKQWGIRRRTDSGLRAGDWISFAEDFRYAPAYPGPRSPGDENDAAVPGLAYVSAQDRPPFVMVASARCFLDRRPPGDDGPATSAGYFYMEALRLYASRVFSLQDEAAAAGPPDLSGNGLDSEDQLLMSVGHLHSESTRIRSSSPPEEGPPPRPGEDRPAPPPPRRPVWLPRVRLSGLARVLRAGAPRDADAPDPVHILATPLHLEYAAANSTVLAAPRAHTPPS